MYSNTNYKSTAINQEIAVSSIDETYFTLNRIKILIVIEWLKWFIFYEHFITL